MNWESVIVSKPWGREFLIYQNGQVSVWCLEIKAGCQTSMHAHPNKLTGIIMVSGEAEFSFLNNPPQRMVPLDKRVLHQRVFHQTFALVDTTVLETESPPDKLDLTRLTDQYGREGEPYEGSDKMQPRNNLPMLSMGGQKTIGGCQVMLHRLCNEQLHPSYGNHVHAFLKGGIVGKQGQIVSIPGDLIWSHDLKRLLQIADIIEGTEVMTVW